MGKLLLEPLERALASLREILSDVEKHPHMLGLRDGAIKRFEYCYELTVSTMRRVVESVSGSQGKMARMTFAGIVREALDYGLIEKDFFVWNVFREKRNECCHMYNSAVADDVFAALPSFLKEAETFLTRAKEFVANG